LDLFKFTPGSDPTVLEQGRMIKGAKNVMWVERYRDPGEFEIQAPLSSGLREFLPAGTFVSHADTFEFMIVESHEISEEEGEDPLLKITGRSFETYLENRIVGVNQARSSSTIVEYNLAAANTWNQAVTLINDHILNTTDPNDALGNIQATTTITGTGTNEARVIARGNVHAKLMELLAIDDIGIYSNRRSTFPGGNPTFSTLSIHAGVNKSSSVIFSWKSGDLDSADYLFSDKKLKNSALVLGRYVYTMVDTGPTKYDRRIALVDGTDLDGNLSAPPTGGALTTIIGKMQTRGRQALKSQNRLSLSRADISDVTKYQYRRDFKVGDFVTLDANYGQIAVMRVVEYAEIEDENGESGHPTLAIPGV
jgi:hypothetical protein